MKVLLVTPTIPEYRYHFYKALAGETELTVLHKGPECNFAGSNFRQIIAPLCYLGPFRYFKIRLHKLCKKHDLVIADSNIRYIDRIFLIINPFRTYKWIGWGIGVSANYDKEYDSSKAYDFIRYFVFRKTDANIFYSEYPVTKYVKKGFKRESLFTAHNTTFVSFNEKLYFQKNIILFIGTLYIQKKIFDLLDSYLEASKLLDNIFPLYIIGDGSEKGSIVTWIKKNELGNKVFLTGSVFDHNLLEKYFRSALACISPGQAGLSVLSSMGYGTPFITMENAITGGEIFNITNGETGIIYENNEDLKNIIVEINTNPEKYIDMGLKARDHYIKRRQIKHMLQGFTDAIKYCMEYK